MIAEYFSNNIFSATPFTMETSAWYFSSAIFMLGVILALAVWAFHTAAKGRQLWRNGLLD